MEQNNLSLYRIFYEVCRTQNISRAAKELYISQPAISKSISRLEENLSTTLFTRNSRGVQPTEEGRILYEHVRSAFESLDAGEEQLRHIRELGIGQVRIGVSSTLCKHVLVPYLQEFIRLHPHVNISIESQDSARTLDMLEQGQVDIGLVAEPRSKKNLDFFPAMNIHDTFVAADSYLDNLSRREGSREDLFHRGSFMMLDRGNMTRNYVDSFLFENGAEPRRVLEVNSMDLIIDFARIGMGIGCVIREFVQDDLASGRLREVPLGIGMKSRVVGFAHMKNTGMPNAVLQFIQFYKNKK